MIITAANKEINESQWVRMAISNALLCVKVFVCQHFRYMCVFPPPIKTEIQCLCVFPWRKIKIEENEYI